MLKRLQLWEVSQKGILWVIYATMMLALFTVCLPAAKAAPAPLNIEPTMYEAPVELTRVFAQVGPSHSVALSWVLSTDDTTGGCTAPNTCSQTIYRALGACSSSNTFASIASPSASTAAFTDLTVVPGTYCYGVSFTQNGLESVKDTATVILPPFGPSSLAGIPH